MARVERGHPVFAFLYARMAPRAERDGTAERRRALLAGVRGRVLELGAGTGLNLAHYPGGVSQVVATEPDPYMARRLVRAAVSASVPVHVERAMAEALPLPDASVDTVVSTFVLCSVRDPVASLAEVRRVLRPEGRLLFYEHVRAEDLDLARRQDRWERPWGAFGAGCHPNRDTVARIEASGFEVERLERMDVPGTWLTRPHAIGVARPLPS